MVAVEDGLDGVRVGDLLVADDPVDQCGHGDGGVRKERPDHLIHLHRLEEGLVSLDVPLISNLPVWSNIALIRQYHENMPWEEAKRLAQEGFTLEPGPKPRVRDFRAYLASL